MLKKVVIIGPESTGKSTLCKQLAAHFESPCCPEFARDYLSEHGMDYTYDDLLVIAKGQIELEEQYEKAMGNRQSAKTTIERSDASNSPFTIHHSPLFIDTDMYVMKIWCEFVFGKCHQYILDQIAARKYDLYLLCNIDLPWIKDELRKCPDLEKRKQLYDIYKHAMMNQLTPWADIDGSYEERLKKAIEAVNDIVA